MGDINPSDVLLIDVRFGKLPEVKQSQGFTVSNERLIYPIPQGERDINKNLTQNPGY